MPQAVLGFTLYGKQGQADERWYKSYLLVQLLLLPP